ncbi:DUF6234 family protein [Cellulomonas sp. 179-A 9B4 NHS]|uniref:DUF6234 family protein n=1 Tax=Cellulomonas sp. 179-A 9B4 NHS TaxID=3142379 RepID=UPI0039A3A384
MADARHDDDRRTPDPVRVTAPTAIGQRPPRRSLVRPLASLCLTVGAMLIVTLFGQHFAVYFSIGGPGNVATEAEQNRYVVTATACLVLLVIGTGAAIATRRHVLTALGMVLVVVGVVVAVGFAVPPHDWERDPPPPPADRPICRSGGDSDDGPGG